MSPLLTTASPTSDGCNGVNAEILGVELASPTDVCINSQADVGDYSIMYSCNTGMLHTYYAADCAGDYVATELDDDYTMTCDASDCSYGVITQYNSTAGGCDNDTFVAAPVTTDCYSMTTSLGDVSVDLFCADNSTNGGIISAVVWIGGGGVDCGVGNPVAFDNALSAFSLFPDIDADCLDMQCYQSGYHSVDLTFYPSPEP